MFALMVGANVVRLVVALDHFHSVSTLGTEVRRGDIPAYKVALGIVGATVERLSRLGNAFAHVTAALGTFSDNFDDFLDVLALWIVGASQERTVFAVAHDHFAPHLSQITSLSSSGI